MRDAAAIAAAAIAYRPANAFRTPDSRESGVRKALAGL